MCEKLIETAVKSLEGVSYAEWNVTTKELVIIHNPEKASIDDISKKIAESGYDVGSKYKASDEKYDALHACCKYRK